MKMDRVAEEDSVQSTPAETKAFLNEYEGLTHLYRLLHARQLSDPSFLHRNIKFNKKKSKKKASINGSAKIAQSSRLENIVVKLKKEANSAMPTDHLCIHFNGVSGVEKCGRDYVEAQILFKGMCTPKRKPSDQEQIFWKKDTVLMLNPKKSVFSEMVKIPYPAIENASRLVFNMKFPESENEELEEKIDPSTSTPPKKRTKFSAAIPEINEPKNGPKRNRVKLNGNCQAIMELDKPIKEGDYEINIEKQKIPEVNGVQTKANKLLESQNGNRRDLHWATMGGGQTWPNLESSLPQFAQVRFMVGWSEAICHMREPRQPLKASAPVEEVKVIYQFFYQNRARVLSESRPNPRCIWCDRLFKSVKDLLTHLKASHDKFTYSTPESKAIANGMKLTSVHIEVYPNPLKTCSYLGNPNLADMVDVGRIIFHRGPGPIKRTNTKGTQVLIWNGKIIDPSANTEESGELDRSVCSLITQGHRRLYFHTHSNMPVRACEFDVDSEDDSREEFRWIRENMFNQINEFTDVNKDEKLVMQLWNHHLMSRKVLSTNHIYDCCKEISLRYSKFILKSNLRRNYLLHLLNLVDHCLLKPSKVPEIMEILDQESGEEEPDFLGLVREEEKLREIIRVHAGNDRKYFD